MLLGPSVTNAERSFRPDPETIPPTGAVEVARIVYPDGPRIVRVVASRGRSGIAYRVLSGNRVRRPCRGPARLPLTMGQLVWLLDRSRQGVAYWCYLMVTHGIKRPHLPRFEIGSAHYPALHGYFSRRACALLCHWSQTGRGPASWQMVEATRQGLLTRLRWEERQAGFTRTSAQREARAEHFLAMRFGPGIIGQAAPALGQ